MIIVLNSGQRFEDKLKSVLDTMLAKEENSCTILLPIEDFVKTSDWMKSHKAIQTVRAGSEDFFVIKQMRLEVKPIDFFI